MTTTGVLIPSEIRVGNWVNLENRGPHQWEYTDYADYVKSEQEGYRVRDHHGVDALISDKVEPIEITAELLEKAGFLPVNSAYATIEYHKEGFTKAANFTDRYSNWYDLEVMEFVITSTPYDEVVVKCEYLHQLQNLYFSLTGEELNIEL